VWQKLILIFTRLKSLIDVFKLMKKAKLQYSEYFPPVEVIVIIFSLFNLVSTYLINYMNILSFLCVKQTVDALVSFAAIQQNPTQEFTRLYKAIGTPAVLLMISDETKSMANAAMTRILDKNIRPNTIHPKNIRHWIRGFASGLSH